MDREGMGTSAPAIRSNLETRCYRNLAIGGAFLAIGLIMTLTVMLAWWGIPLVIVGGVIIAFSVIQALRTLQREGIDVACPYCQRTYRIEPERRHLLCDDCQREIPIIPRVA